MCTPLISISYTLSRNGLVSGRKKRTAFARPSLRCFPRGNLLTALAVESMDFPCSNLEKNEMYFQIRDCITLVRPVLDEKQLQGLNKVLNIRVSLSYFLLTLDLRQ